MGADAVHRGKILPSVAILLVTELVQEHALSVRTLLMAEPGGAIFRRAQLRPQDSFAVHGAVDRLDAFGRVLLPLECHIDTERLVLAVRAFPIANRDFLDVAVLTKKFGATQRSKQFVFSNRWSQTCHINKVLLHDSYTDEVLAILFLRLALLNFLLPLFSCSLLLIFLDVGPKLGDPK